MGESNIIGGQLDNTTGKLFWQAGAASAYQFTENIGLTADFLLSGKGTKNNDEVTTSGGIWGDRTYKYDEKVSNQTNLFDNINNIGNEVFEFEKVKPWTKKELLNEEFISLGFYISDHPLNEYKEFFTHLEIESYKDFMNNDKSETLVAGTIMSIQEKKVQKVHLLQL